MLRTLICVCFVSLAAFVSIHGQTVKGSKSAANPPAASGKIDVDLIEGKVLLVIDGDQFRVKTPAGIVYTVRLHGVDAPEDLQPYGPEARKALEGLALGKSVRVAVQKRDSLGRQVGTAYIKGQDVAVRLLENGHAWHYKRFSGEQASGTRERYAVAELKARDAKSGLWAHTMPIPPWEYRDSLVSAGTNKEAKQDKKPQKAVTTASKSTDTAVGRKYLAGPRGGCYYLNEAGAKVYVKDRSLCTKP